MQCCLFLSVSNLHGLSINYSTNSKIVNLNLVRSLAIKLPHTLKCNLQFTIIVIKTVAIFYIRTSLQSTLLYWQHDKAIWLSYPYAMTQDLSFWWHRHVHWHRYLFLRDELSILSKRLAFAGNPWCFAICTSCFEKCTYCFANVKDDSRDVSKQLRKTVISKVPQGWPELLTFCKCVWFIDLICGTTTSPAG